MQLSRVFILMCFVCFIIPSGMPLFAQNYPSKPIRVLVPSAGSAGDFVARVIAPGLSASLGQQVVVENQGSAGGIIAANTVGKAPADGYTLLLYGNGIWLLPFLRDNVSYDPVRDFLPISLMVRSPHLLVVHPSLPVNSVKELIALAKAKPGELNYGSATGATPHFAAELFKSMAGVNIVRIPYKGSRAALNDLIAGQVQLMFPTAGSVTQHVKSGRLNALAVTSAQPSALNPGLPTVAASGLPDYEAVTPFGIFAKANTPEAIIIRLHQEIVRGLNRTDVKEKILASGVEVVASSPEEFAAAVKSDMAKWGKIIKDVGIRDE